MAITTEQPAHSAYSIDNLIQRAAKLYSLPAVALEVVNLTGSEQVNVADIKSCIERDPALAAKILKVVNSPVFGLSGQISDLNQALALLGIKPLKLLVLGFSLPKELLQSVEAEALSAYWQFSLTKAIVARELARRSKSGDADDAFIAGLLSEIGMLLLLQELGDTYAEFVAKVTSEHADLSQMELDTLGFDHGILSCRLLEAWSLPDTLIDTIRQANPTVLSEKRNRQPTAHRLHIAHRLAEMLSRQRLDLLPEVLTQLKEFTGLRQNDVENLAAEIQIRVMAMADAMSVQLDTDIDYSQVMIDAHGLLATVAESAAAPLAIQEKERQQRVKSSQQVADLTSALSQTPKLKSPEESQPKKPDNHVAQPSTSSEVVAAIPTRALDAVLNKSIADSRRRRSELSLILLGIDDYDPVWLSTSDDVAALEQLLRLMVDRLTDGTGLVISVGDSQMAVVLPEFDRNEAVSLGRKLLEIVPNWSQRRGSQISLSGGIASCACCPKNLSADEFLESAERCLNGASRGGGNGLKSIEIM